MTNRLPVPKPGLLRQSLDGQTLVFDPATESVHLLDVTTGVVLDLLQEGGWTREGISHELKSRLGVTDPQSFFQLSIEQLHSVDLLSEEPSIEDSQKVDRRELIRRVAAVGLSTLLVPAIVTVTASPAHATSGGTAMACVACTTDGDCDKTNTCVNGACTPEVNSGGLANGSACSGTFPAKADGTCDVGKTTAAANLTCCNNKCPGGTVTGGGIGGTCTYSGGTCG